MNTFNDVILFLGDKKSSHLRAFLLHQFDALLACRGNFEDFHFKGNIFACQWVVKIDFCNVIIDRFYDAEQGCFGFIFKLNHVTNNWTLFKFDGIEGLNIFRIPRTECIFWR